MVVVNSNSPIFIDRNGQGEVIINHVLWSEQDKGEADNLEKQRNGWILICRYATGGAILWAKPNDAAQK